MAANGTSRKARGTVFVRPELCKGCDYCIEFCPTDCLEFSPNFNAKGYHYPVLARPEDCTGCGLCGLYCPDFAIFGMRFEEIEAMRERIRAQAQNEGGTPK
ncbi:ferredoxin family protein [Myxococcota bacterium]|jgi:2-oxoglutarate ferredoxin oxidoreductase subunit delta|nr:ferredoxin family protein [Myxococcota bacterium]